MPGFSCAKNTAVTNRGGLGRRFAKKEYCIERTTEIVQQKVWPSKAEEDVNVETQETEERLFHSVSFCSSNLPQNKISSLVQSTAAGYITMRTNIVELLLSALAEAGDLPMSEAQPLSIHFSTLQAFRLWREPF